MIGQAAFLSETTISRSDQRAVGSQWPGLSRRKGEAETEGSHLVTLFRESLIY